MKGQCRYCRCRLEKSVPQFVTRGLCQSCAGIITRSRRRAAAFIDSLEVPLLFLQGNPRQIVTANHWARDLFTKELSEIEGKRGGQVFDCVNAFTELGCGLDPGCADCLVKSAVVDTLESGRSYHAVSTTLAIRRPDRVDPHDIVFATERIGTHALLRIDCFTRAAGAKPR